MKLTINEIRKIPNEENVHFEPKGEKTEVTCWTSVHTVARLTLDTICEKACTITKKTIQMMKLFNNCEITINNSFNIKSSCGKYKGAISTATVPFEFNHEGAVAYQAPKRIINVASKFAATDDKKPILTGINIGESGIVATDSYKMVLYRSANEGGVTVDAKFFDSIEGEYDQILVDGNKVLVEADGVEHLTTALSGTYPNVSRLFQEGQKTGINVDDIQEQLTLAIKSLDQNTQKDGVFVGAIVFDSDGHTLTISSDNYSFDTELEISGIPCKFKIAARHVQAMLGNCTELSCQGLNRPIQSWVAGTECKYLFIPQKLED